jgi:hypothetical protein
MWISLCLRAIKTGWRAVRNSVRLLNSARRFSHMVCGVLGKTGAVAATYVSNDIQENCFSLSCGITPPASTQDFRKREGSASEAILSRMCLGGRIELRAFSGGFSRWAIGRSGGNWRTLRRRNGTGPVFGDWERWKTWRANLVLLPVECLPLSFLCAREKFLGRNSRADRSGDGGIM